MIYKKDGLVINNKAGRSRKDQVPEPNQQYVMHCINVRFGGKAPENLNEVIGKAFDNWLKEALDPSAFILTEVVVTDSLPFAINSSSADVVILVSEADAALLEELREADAENTSVCSFADLGTELLKQLKKVAPEQQMPPLKTNLAAK